MKRTNVTPKPESPELEKQKQFDLDLKCIAHAWPKLSDNVRQAIRTIVAVSFPDEKDSHYD